MGCVVNAAFFFELSQCTAAKLRRGFIDQMRDFTVSVYWARGPIAGWGELIQVTRRDEDQREIQLTATEARQGTTPHVTRYILTWGLGLVIVASAVEPV
jgi:hypothetical protein